MKVFCSVLVISLVSAMAVDAKTRTPVSERDTIASSWCLVVEEVNGKKYFYR